LAFVPPFVPDFARLALGADFGAARRLTGRPFKVFLVFLLFGAADLFVDFEAFRAFFAIRIPPLTLWP
jgi:hypothetical protein